MRLWIITIVESVILLIVTFVAYSSYRGAEPQRQAAVAYRATVEALQAGRIGEAATGLKTLETYCKRNPGPLPGNAHTGAEFVPQIRFLRAGLALHGDDVETAMELYGEVAEDDHADDELASLARTIQAALVFQANQKDPVTAAEKALDILRKRRDRQLPDALAAEAACLLWKKDFEGAEKRYAEISSLRPCRMSFEACKSFYVGAALVDAHKGDLDAARKKLVQVQFYDKDKDWRVPKEYLQLLRVQLLSQDERGDPAAIAARERLLKEIERSWAKHVIGDDEARYATLMSIGMAYTRGAREQRHRSKLKDEQAKLLKALNTFRQAADLDKKNPVAFQCIAALRWERLLNLRVLVASYRKISSGASARVRSRHKKALAGLALEISEAEDAYTASHYKLAGMSALSKEEEIAGLKAIAGFQLLRAEVDGWQKVGVAASLEALETVLAKDPDEADVLRAKGVLLQRQGKLAEALAAWKKTLALKDDPALARLVGSYESKPQIVAWRPTRPPGAARASLVVRSRAPLVGFLFQPARAGEVVSPEDVKLYLDDIEVPAKLSGTEVLYLVPRTEPLSDGRHTVRGTLRERLGTTVEGSFTFLVDNSPPEIDSVSPAEHDRPRSGKPRIKIKYHDALSGVDPSSVRLDLRSVPPTMPALSVTLIEGGRYTFNDPENGIVKDTPAATPKFIMVVPSRNLGPGRYELRLEVGDARGLKTRKSWIITVGR